VLDMVGAISLSSLFIVMVGSIAFAAPWSRPARTSTAVVLLAWGAFIVAISASGFFEHGHKNGIPAVAFGVVPPLLVAILAWLFLPAVRRGAMDIPITLLTALNLGRILGIFFILLQFGGRLSAPFAPSAGWGDVATGLLAIPVTLSLLRGSKNAVGYAQAWNIFGVLDLFAAVGLGIASSPDASFRIFDAAPGTAAMGTLPWVLIPTVLVPFYLAIHLVIAARLMQDKRPAFPNSSFVSNT
jgi:hypothetical protein